MELRMSKIAAVLVLCFVMIMQLNAFAATGTVSTDDVNIRSGPGTGHGVLGKANTNDRYYVLATEGSWCAIDFQGSRAYMSAQYIDIIVTDLGEATDVVNIRTAPGMHGSIIGRFATGDVMHLADTIGDWYQIILRGELVYVHRDYVHATTCEPFKARAGAHTDPVQATPSVAVSAPSASATGQAVVDYAAQFYGTPYVSGGASPGGFDCSGFTYYVYQQFGVGLPRTASGQASVGTTVSRDALAPGDLVFFDTYGGISHVAIYVGGGQILHATQPGDILKYSDMNSSYYSSRYVTAVRIF